MLMGIRLQARPTKEQKLTLSKWMGCARFVWNAKCEENKYLTTFARKYLPVGTYAPTDAKYSQYKDKELSPWLKDCPSQILRNSVSKWYFTYEDFKVKKCGKPKKKKKTSGGSIYLTNELFSFSKENGRLKLFIGSKRNNIGVLELNYHTYNFKEPNSIRIKKKNGQYWVAFCYEDDLKEDGLFTEKENLEFLKGCTKEYLEHHTVGIDRGVVRPVQFGEKVFDFTEEQKRKKKFKEKYIKRYQRKLSKQKKGSNKREKTKHKIAKAHQKISNIRLDFCHKASKKMVADKQAKILVFEDLKTKSMSKKPKAKPNTRGSWDRNNARAKAGLNRSILDKGWHKLESFTKYKAYRAGKAVFKVPAHHTSQECADCSHIHPDNRKRQDLFVCVSCGHTDNADKNASEVIKKRAIKLILDSGTELSERGVLFDSGRGAKVRRGKRNATHAVAKKRQKRRESSSELVLEANPL
jgi:putative transposase